VQTLLMLPEAACALHGPIAVSSVNGRLTAPLVQQLSDACAQHRRAYAGREISFTLTREGVLLPDDGARRLINELNKKGDAATYSVVVIDGSGFWAAAARGMLASLSLVSKAAPAAHKTVREALEYVKPYMKDDVECHDLDALERDLLAFRREHISAFPAARR
jgi:hypothetical protein